MSLCRYVWDDGLDPTLYERSPINEYVALEKFYESDYKIAQQWCEENGYTELHFLKDAPSKLWAYPPNGSMAVPLDLIKIKGELAAHK